MAATPPPPALRPDARFVFAHPAHTVALAAGAGLSPWAAGTVGTLWAWLVFVVLQPWMNDGRWALLLAAALPLGWWACSVTARALQRQDPGCIVWDEVLGFWLVLWLLMPAHWGEQLAAFALFRYFDAAKPGPVGWADRLYADVDAQQQPRGWWRIGWGILLDDLVAAGCTLLLLAVWRAL